MHETFFLCYCRISYDEFVCVIEFVQTMGLHGSVKKCREPHGGLALTESLHESKGDFA